ncbi:MAG: PulJ/GspJ family protein [Planctomycetaceae bacterium]
MLNPRPRRQPATRSAFTILEVLIALTASLLIMLGLTRAFKLIGDSIGQSQSELVLSGTLRDVTYRMRDELLRVTSPMDAPQPQGAAAGYFTYYEGPWSDATTTLVNGNPALSEAGHYVTSRYGDLDDYLAFTAKAKPDAPFTGIVPAGVIEAHRLEEFVQTFGALPSAANRFVTLSGKQFPPTSAADTYTLVDAAEPTVITSDYAEIVYYCNPRWVRDALGQPTYDAAGNPLFEDNINEVPTATTTLVGDNIPDQLSLHRRVLLIRPDLNMSAKRMYAATFSALGMSGVDEDIDQLPVLLPGATPTIRPLSAFPSPPSPAAPDHRYNPGPWAPGLPWPGGTVNVTRPPWLTGLARVQQLVDLSLCRVTNSWAAPGTAGYGMPADTTLAYVNTPAIAANSLVSLERPENRFGFVRMPLSLVNGTANASTMPLLGLCPPHAFLREAENSGIGRFGQAVPSSTGPVVYGSLTMTGFLRPEFSLTDYSLANPSTTANAVATFRGGADVIATDVLGFDVQVFDADAPNFIWLGNAATSQNVAGRPGDDDGDGTSNELDELGLPGTDDVLISTGSLGINPTGSSTDPAVVNVFESTTTTLPAGANEFFLTQPGGFVDFGYARLPGGVVGGFDATAPLATLFSTSFSGRVPYAGSANATYPDNWSLSGRFVQRTGAGSTMVSTFVQPLIDTGTVTYDGDGFEQPTTTVSGFNLSGSTLIPSPPSPPPHNMISSRVWTNAVETVSSGPGFEDGSASSSQATPPSASMPRAIKITLRVYDPASGQVRQQSVIHEFAK